MKFKCNTRFNLSSNVTEVNCIGFFGSDFFSMAELKVRQDLIFDMYKRASESHNSDDITLYSSLYEATEVMRITILEQNLKESSNTKL